MDRYLYQIVNDQISKWRMLEITLGETANEVLQGIWRNCTNVVISRNGDEITVTGKTVAGKMVREMYFATEYLQEEWDSNNNFSLV